MSGLKRAWFHYRFKLDILFREREYKAHGTRVKHLFYSGKDSDVLIVSFPACSPGKPRYNYVRTLAPFKVNKLFLLDDFADNHKGCYLVEENVEKCTIDLIRFIMEKCGNPSKIFFIGGSKGGYSALSFSFRIPGVIPVIGAPQYFLGTYLGRDYNLPSLRFIIGEVTEDGKRKLDGRLKSLFFNSPVRPAAVNIHYSTADLTYERHVRDLLNDMKEAGIDVREDVGSYEDHGDLKLYFPPYLLKTIKDCLN